MCEGAHRLAQDPRPAFHRAGAADAYALCGGHVACPGGVRAGVALLRLVSSLAARGVRGCSGAPVCPIEGRASLTRRVHRLAASLTSGSRTPPLLGRVYPVNASRLRQRREGEPPDPKGPVQWLLTALVFGVLAVRHREISIAEMAMSQMLCWLTNRETWLSTLRQLGAWGHNHSRRGLSA